MISQVCPQEIRVDHRRNNQEKWRSSPEWKEFVRVHTGGKPCNHCGVMSGEVRGNRKPAIITVNHLSRRKYASKEEYLTWDDDCEVCCTTCNWMFEKGRKPCPRCGIRYIHWTDDICQACYDQDHPEEAARRKQAKKEREAAIRVAKRQKKNPHPCKFRYRTGQGCKQKEIPFCNYDRRRARQCPKFKERVKG